MNRDKIVKKYLGPQEGQEVTDYLDEIGFRKKFRPEERFFKAVEREMSKNMAEFYRSICRK